MTRPTIVWLRQDLRLADNPALRAAVDRGDPVLVLYALDDETPGLRPLGGASRWWLHHSLASLATRITALGSQLVLRRGAGADVVRNLVAETGARAVVWNRRYGRGTRTADADLKEELQAAGVSVHSYQANLLFEPWAVRTGGGKPYQVFTPFWRSCLGGPQPRAPLPAPDHIRGPAELVNSEELATWKLLPSAPDWAGGLREMWTPGEMDAQRRLDDFADGALAEYGRRDEPALQVTSLLSPSLAFGEVSPFQIWHRLNQIGPLAQLQRTKFLSEVGWREFHYHVAFHAEDLATVHVRRQFDDFGWGEPEQDEFDRWRYGRTGIALVDAGMRELWHTGYLHNRVRMVAASFLVKNLLVDWRFGEQWFWDTLVDADEASNPGNWQWVAGSGADAAPYFRIFNPVTQEKKFDPDRAYVRRWVPEVDSPEYPEPMVDLNESRQSALDAYQLIKK